MPRFYDFLPGALAEGQPFALGIISRIKGSSPQKKGAKALFFPDGRIQGTLGGGCLEAEIQDRARRSLATKTPATFELVLDHDFGWDDGLICGGKVCGLILPLAPEAKEIWQELARCEEPLTWGVKKDFTIAWVDNPADEGWLYQETVSPPCALWIAGSGTWPRLWRRWRFNSTLTWRSSTTGPPWPTLNTFRRRRVFGSITGTNC